MPQALEATGWRPASPPPATDTTVYAQRGDRLGDVAQRYGVDENALRKANPELAQAQSLPLGQPVRLPAPDEAGLSPAAAGVLGAAGREGLVQSLQARAYKAGQAAPQTAFDGDVLRAVSTRYEAGALDHNHGSPGRYNAGGQGMLYTAPDAASVLHEGAAYAAKGQHPLANRTVVEMNFRATPDATGQGGVADIAEGARRTGLPVAALTEPKGGKPPSLLHQLTGEHPYTLPQQASKGASDRGATALRAPAATCDAQIDIVTRNAQPSQITPLNVTRYDASGNVVSTANAAGVVKPMPADPRAHADGPLQKGAGVRPPMQFDAATDKFRLAGADAPGKPLSAVNEGPVDAKKGVLNAARHQLTGAGEGRPRAASTRYGAAGGAAASLVDAGVRVARGEQVSAREVATATTGNAALGAAGAKFTDLAKPFFKGNLVKAGGAAGALVQAGVSGYSNVQAYRAGEISGARATANTVVDTGTALAAGAAGAWVGGAVGSVVPVAGTAVGAVVGFGVGVGVHYAIGAADKLTGLTSKAKDGLTSVLDSASSGASKAWSAITPW